MCRDTEAARIGYDTTATLDGEPRDPLDSPVSLSSDGPMVIVGADDGEDPNGEKRIGVRVRGDVGRGSGGHGVSHQRVGGGPGETVGEFSSVDDVRARGDRHRDTTDGRQRYRDSRLTDPVCVGRLLTVGYLFGSLARGEVDGRSDVDIAVAFDPGAGVSVTRELVSLGADLVLEAIDGYLG